MSGCTRVGTWTAGLVAVLLAAACAPFDPPTMPEDEGLVSDSAADSGREVPGPSDAGDAAPDEAPEAWADVPAPDLPVADAGSDPGPGDAASSDPGGADLPLPDLVVDPGPGDLAPVDPGSGDLHADLGPGELPADPGPADLPVDPGQPPDVSCRAGQVVFPDFERACGLDADCGLAFHQADCCGSIEVRGIRADRLDDFQAAEDVCRAQWPACGCAGRIPTADDGSTSGDLGDFEVSCESGQCRSRAVAGCGDLERRVEEALAVVDACSPGSVCVLREMGPICGSFSCRQVAVAAGASPEGLAVLDVLGGEGMTKGCKDFHCGCDYLGVPSCVEGHCRLLPPGDDCQAVKDRLDAFLADPATRTCGKDADCAGTTVTFAPFCTTECACAVVTNQAAATGVQTLSSQWQQLGCPIESCACTKCATILRCVEGRCTGLL